MVAIIVPPTCHPPPFRPTALELQQWHLDLTCQALARTHLRPLRLQIFYVDGNDEQLLPTSSTSSTATDDNDSQQRELDPARACFDEFAVFHGQCVELLEELYKSGKSFAGGAFC